MSDIDVKKIRSMLKLSQDEMAKSVGVSLRTIQNWEAGQVVPKSKYAILHNLMAIGFEQNSGSSRDRHRGPIFAKSGRDSNIATDSSTISSSNQDVNAEIWNELKKCKEQNAVLQEIINNKNEEIIKLNREIVELYRSKNVQ